MADVGKIVAAGATALSIAGGVATVATTVYDKVVERTEYNSIHEIVETDTYTVNGIEVTKDEYDNYIIYLNELFGVGDTTNSSNENIEKVSEDENKVETDAINITSSDLDIDGVARLSSYLDFEYDDYSNLIGIKINSADVVSIEYEYSDSLMSYVDDGKFTGQEYMANVYQDVSQDDITFVKGMTEGVKYTVINTVEDVKVGTYVFKFTNNDTFSNITFDEVFNTITLNVMKK